MPFLRLLFNHFSMKTFFVQSIRLSALALQTQISLAIGFSFCLLTSYFFVFAADARYPVEQPWVIWTGFLLSLAAYFVGKIILGNPKEPLEISFRDGAIIVLLTWLFATLISTTVFVLAGFPMPARVGDFSLLRRFVDGVYESISGFTTAGGSILPSVESFPRSILMWRSMTHLLGGMGMAYLAVTLLARFPGKRSAILNGEAEGPNEVRFDNEKDARTAGFDFLKIYLLLNGLMIVLLILAGLFGRAQPYAHLYDNVFDAIAHTFSSMGTGGFGVYDESVGLPVATDSGIIIGGLENPSAEWIITIFMLLAGGNLSLWYILFFRCRHWKSVMKNKELQAYVGFVACISVGIWLVLMHNDYYDTPIETFRYAIFNVATIISTTGLGNANFHLWPAGAIGLLFLVYFTGGMVGSTAGGPKIARYVILFRFMWMQMQNLLFGRHLSRFKIDDVVYDMKAASMVTMNVVLYFMIFMVGAIAIMIVSPVGVFPDGSTRAIDLITGITASIANLGNIGPTAALGSIDAGPAGNYFAFSVGAKLVMSLLMMIGRVGVFTFLILFISRLGLREMDDSVTVQHFDADMPHIKK